MAIKKYELIESDIAGLYRIRALKTIRGVVKKGDIGGYVQSEDNLAQTGNCWIYDNAKVIDKARVKGQAKVYDNAYIAGSAIVTDKVRIEDNSMIIDNATIAGNASIGGEVFVHEEALIMDKVIVRDYAEVKGHAQLYNEAQLSGYCIIAGYAVVQDNAIISGFVKISGTAHINSQAIVRGAADISEGTIIGDVIEPFDKIWFFQGSGRLMTIYTQEGKVYCNIGCQQGLTYEELEERIALDGGMKPHRQEYLDIMKAFQALV